MRPTPMPSMAWKPTVRGRFTTSIDYNTTSFRDKANQQKKILRMYRKFLNDKNPDLSKEFDEDVLKSYERTFYVDGHIENWMREWW